MVNDIVTTGKGESQETDRHAAMQPLKKKATPFLLVIIIFVMCSTIKLHLKFIIKLAWSRHDCS